MVRVGWGRGGLAYGMGVRQGLGCVRMFWGNG